MGLVSLNEIMVTSLDKISTEGGDVMHAMKKSSLGFKAYGEAYFSSIQYNNVKAWKKHNRMTLNLVVPSGSVRFVFALNPIENIFRVEEIGENRYFRLTVPPGIWFGFQGLSSGSSLILNIADIEHDPSEVLKKPSSAFSFDWSKL